MDRACPQCGANDFEQDPSSGSTYCVRCGVVVDESNIVNEVAFGETSAGAAMVQGSFVGADQTHARPSGLKKQNSLESREQTLAHGRRRIAELAHRLKLPERHGEAAARWFTLAVSHNFVQGRRSQYVVASCLYVVCRQEKTSHMLIDFSDALDVNVFKLGSTFLRLVRVLNLKLPIVDPSLYISRFAAMLEFGAETQKVASDAVRLVQRMDRDWIQQGRRPAGICGACLLIAARMNNFRRSIPEVVYVVKVADMTVQKRLQEFKSTPSGDLTVEQFRNIWIEQGDNPPSFDQVRKRRRIEARDEAEDESKDNTTSAGPDESGRQQREMPIDPQLLAAANDAYQNEAAAGPSNAPVDSEMALANEIQQTMEQSDFRALAKEANENRRIAEGTDADGNLSDLDEDELDSFILDENESTLKTKVWMEFNRDYLAAQEAKRLRLEADEKAGVTKQPRKRKRTAKPKDSSAADLPGTPLESGKQMLQQRAFSKKINYAALEFLFDKNE